jgi:hypothetical protein
VVGKGILKYMQRGKPEVPSSAHQWDSFHTQYNCITKHIHQQTVHAYLPINAFISLNCSLKRCG